MCHGCISVVHACAWHSRASGYVCKTLLTHMKCREQNGTFHVYHPHVAPMYSNVSNVLVYDPYITVCVCLYCMFLACTETRNAGMRERRNAGTPEY